jgi:hypothetical protein
LYQPPAGLVNRTFPVTGSKASSHSWAKSAGGLGTVHNTAEPVVLLFEDTVAKANSENGWGEVLPDCAPSVVVAG